MSKALSKKMNDFGLQVFDILKTMDREADTLVDEYHKYHAGLSAYEIHTRYGDNKHEASVRDGIMQRLIQAGYSVIAERDYPRFSSRKCDLVIRDIQNIETWLEIKIAWMTWFRTVTGCIERRYASRCRSILTGSSSDTSLVYDFDKLNAAAVPDGSVRAVLLLGFSEVSSPIWRIIEHLFEGADARCKDWHQVGPATWPDVNCPTTQRECYFWWR